MQVRDLDSDVQQRLRDAAEREGLSLSAYLRRELTRLANQVTLQAQAEDIHVRARNRLGITHGAYGNISADQVVEWIREGREER